MYQWLHGLLFPTGFQWIYNFQSDSDWIPFSNWNPIGSNWNPIGNWKTAGKLQEQSHRRLTIHIIVGSHTDIYTLLYDTRYYARYMVSELRVPGTHFEFVLL